MAHDPYTLPKGAAAKPQVKAGEDFCRILDEEIQFVGEDGRLVE